MKTLIINTSIILWMLIFLASCSEDQFTKIVDIDQEEIDIELVSLAEFNTEDSENTILVSETKTVIDQSSFSRIEDCSIQLHTPNQGVIDISYDEWKNLYAIEDVEFTSGETYKLQVSHTEYPTMIAETTVPSTPSQISIDLEREKTENSERHIVKLSFLDPADEENFYKLEGFLIIEDDSLDRVRRDSYYFYTSNDNIFENSNNGYISDITFNGKLQEITFTDWLGRLEANERIVSSHISLTSVSDDQMRYRRSIELARDAENNPFMEPTSIYTNFDFGNGIFSIDSKTTEIFEF